MAKKILIADDEDMVRNVLRLSLQSEGYEIYEAGDGAEALSMAREIVPDLLILDIMMPGMIGYRVCKELKKDPATKDILVMFITSRDVSLAEAAARESGGDDIMGKPFMPDELREKVRRLLGE